MATYSQLILLLHAAVLCTFVRGHSWIACTDYIQKNAGEWNPNLCRGFPRNAEVRCPKLAMFGLDKGYDFMPSDGTHACGERSKVYTRSHPMAVYYPGQQVVLVHPMKNHGADAACGSIWIPDHGSWLYRSEVNRNGQDPTLAEFRKKLVFDLGRSPRGDDFGGDISLSSAYPKPGYGNAPRFCQNTDKALATYSYNVPRNLLPGIYTFLWLWSFNSAGNMYSTCFEVEIVATKAQRDQKLRMNGFSDVSEPCGGVTSNPDIRGSENPGCTPASDSGEYAVVPGEPLMTEAPSPAETTTRKPTTPDWFRFTQRPTNKPATTRSTTPGWYRYTQKATNKPATTKSTTPAWYRYTQKATNKPATTKSTTPEWYRYTQRATSTPVTSSKSSAGYPGGYNQNSGNTYQGNAGYSSQYGQGNSGDNSQVKTSYSGGYGQESANGYEQPKPAHPARKPTKHTSVRMYVTVHMKSAQFSGELWLPVARDDAMRRYISVDFTCPVLSASFWNSMTISDMEESLRTGHFDLIQQGSKELETNRIFYHVTFDNPCDLSVHPPVVRLIREDLMH